MTLVHFEFGKAKVECWIERKDGSNELGLLMACTKYLQSNDGDSGTAILMK